MNRALQREIAALGVATSKDIAHSYETVASTIHVSADMLDISLANGVEIFRDYTAKERRRMASVGHALPDGSFPIGNCSDAEDAIRAQGRAKPEKRAAVKAHIKKRVRALRCSGDIFDPYK